MNRRYVAGGAVLALVAAAALLVSPGTAAATLEWLAAEPLRFGVALLAVALVRPFLAWPTTLVAVAVGFGFGWVGVPFGVVLLTLTALPPYSLSRAGRAASDVGEASAVGAGSGSASRASGSARDAGARFVDASERFADAGERFVGVAGGARTVAATRLLPLPSDAVSIGAGVAGVQLRPFLLGTAVGELPWVIAGVAVGVSADRLVAGDLSALDPALFVGMAGVAALLLAGPFYRAYKSRGSRAASSPP